MTTEQEILAALGAAKRINPKVWRIELSLNESGCDVTFYNTSLMGKEIFATGEGDDIDAAILEALVSLREAGRQ